MSTASTHSPSTSTTIRRVAAHAAALLLVVALLTPGCAVVAGDASPEEPTTPRADRVVTGGGGDEEADGRALAALSEARYALGEGDALAALAAATRGLRAKPSAGVENELRAVRAQARDALVAEQVVQLAAVPSRDVVADGEPVLLGVSIRNVSGATVVIPATAKGSSVSVVVLDVLREDRDVYGNVRETEFAVRIPLDADVRLVPGETFTLTGEIAAESTRLAHVGFAVLRIRGYLRPVGLRVGATELYDALPIDEATVRVLMKGHEPLAASPLDSLADAIRKRSPPHIVTAAELLSPDEHAIAVRLLRDAAERDPPLRFVLEATAARLSGTAGQ